jgi:MoxR-like ATPase
MAKLKDEVIFEDDGQYVRRAEAILKSVGNLRLVGETGTGKSTLVHHLCWKNNWELWEYQLTADTNRWDLLAEGTLGPDLDEHDKATGATKSGVRLGTICKWLMGPFEDDNAKQVLFLDEYNYAQGSVMTLLNSLSDFRGSVHVPELMGSPVELPNFDPKKGMINRIKGKHLIIIGMNPAEKAQYVGTIGMNIAQLNRFESLEVKYLQGDAETRTILRQVPEMNNPKDKQQLAKWIALADLTRAHYDEGDLSTPITTRNIINYCRMYKDVNRKKGEISEGMSETDVFEIMLSMYKKTERSVIVDAQKKV